MSEARTFPRGCVASPHYLASAAGLNVLASGGNAVDAAIAVNLTLGAVTPYLCGFGGDLFAMVWDGSSLHAYNGSGRAPAAATPEAVRAGSHSDSMPGLGPLSVTVPGAVEAWFALLERFGTRPFAELAGPAVRYARDGFSPSRDAASIVDAMRTAYDASPEWREVYGGMKAGTVLRQTGLARTIEVLCAEGPGPFYTGRIAETTASHVRSLGGLLSLEDLREHRGEWVEPLRTGYRDLEVCEMPPNSQGVVALEALNIVEGLEPAEANSPEREHALIEAAKLSLADRDGYVTDLDHMRIDPRELASTAWADDRRRLIDPERASQPAPGRAAVGGTAYMCAADAGGTCVSLIQSNYLVFGSGVTVPGWGINLQNRGASFSLHPSHPNVIAPRKRTMHTLAPAMVMRDGRPWLAFGTMGADGQCQTHLQLLVRIVDDGEDVHRAIDAPRWRVSPSDWSVTAESRFPDGVLDGLRARGHDVATCRPYDHLMGHAHAIEVRGDGYAAASDPRSEGAALGL